MSDIVAVYGDVFPIEKTYEAYVGLWLNIPRLRKVSALATLEGIVGAHSTGTLSEDWFDAMANDPSEIDALSYEINSARAHAAVLRKS